MPARCWRTVAAIVVTLLLLLSCSHGVRAGDTDTFETPTKILEGMSKRGTVAFQKRYTEVWNEVKKEMEAFDEMAASCKTRIEEQMAEFVARNQELRDGQCLPCVDGHCAERMLECDLATLPTEPPECSAVSRALQMIDEDQKQETIATMCSYYKRLCENRGHGAMDSEQCSEFVQDSCLTRFERCAVENTPTTSPSCDQLKGAERHEDIVYLCSYFRRECEQSQDSAACRNSIMHKCREVMLSCDPCQGDFVNSVLCKVYGFGNDVKEFFKEDVTSFFREDVPAFLSTAYSGVSTFFKDDMSRFFKEDVKDFFAKDVKTFFTEDLGDTWTDVKDFFKGDTLGLSSTKDFFEGAWGDVKDFGSDVGDFFEDAADSFSDKLGGAWDSAKEAFSSWFSRRRRRRSVGAAETDTVDAPPSPPPPCDSLRDTETRSEACLLYSSVCPCEEYEELHKLHMEDVCPQVIIAEETIAALKSEHDWLLKIPRDKVYMKFNSFIVDKTNKDPFGLYAARAVLTMGGHRLEFGTRIGLSRDHFQKHLPDVFEHAFQALEELMEKRDQQD